MERLPIEYSQQGGSVKALCGKNGRVLTRTNYVKIPEEICKDIVNLHRGRQFLSCRFFIFFIYRGVGRAAPVTETES